MEVGPIHFLPSKNCFVAKNLTTFFAKSLFDVNMVPLKTNYFPSVSVNGNETLYLSFC